MKIRYYKKKNVSGVRKGAHMVSIVFLILVVIVAATLMKMYLKPVEKYSTLSVVGKDGETIEEYSGEIVILKGPGEIEQDAYAKGERTVIFTLDGEKVTVALPDGAEIQTLK